MSKKSYIICGAVVAVVLVVVFVGLKTYPLPMSCAKAMSEGRAESIWQENQSAVSDLERMYSGTGFSISLDESKCKDKAFIHINYDSSSDRSSISDKIEQTPLRDIPVEWQNV